MATYEVKRPGHAWQDASETVDTAEAALTALADPSQPTTIVLLRNNFNGSVTVFEATVSGGYTNHGPYQRFYGTDQLPE